MESRPLVDPKVAQARSDRAVMAKKQVATWLKLLAAEGQGAGMFSLVGPQSNDFSFYIGKIEEELWSQGFTIASHSHVTIKDDKGAVLNQVSMLVKTKNGEAKRVSLV